MRLFDLSERIFSRTEMDSLETSNHRSERIHRFCVREPNRLCDESRISAVPSEDMVLSRWRRKGSVKDGGGDAGDEEHAAHLEHATSQTPSDAECSVASPSGSNRSSRRPDEAPSHEDATASCPSPRTPVDAMQEMQAQLQAAVSRANMYESKLDRALREAKEARLQKDDAELAQAEAERQMRQKAKELADAERREAALAEKLQQAMGTITRREGELAEEQRKNELLTWKLGEAEENAAGLRAQAMQADGQVELARAEVAMAESRAHELIAQTEQELVHLRMRVLQLESEAVEAQEKVQLAEFRLGEEAARAQALVAEADEITGKLGEAQERVARAEERAVKAEQRVTELEVRLKDIDRPVMGGDMEPGDDQGKKKGGEQEASLPAS